MRRFYSASMTNGSRHTGLRVAQVMDGLQVGLGWANYLLCGWPGALLVHLYRCVCQNCQESLL